MLSGNDIMGVIRHSPYKEGRVTACCVKARALSVLIVFGQEEAAGLCCLVRVPARFGPPQSFPPPPRFPPSPHFLKPVGPLVCPLVPVCYPPIFRTSARNPPLVLADRDHRTARGAGSSKHRAKLKRGGLVALLCPAVGSPPRTFARRSLLIRSLFVIFLTHLQCVTLR